MLRERQSRREKGDWVTAKIRLDLHRQPTPSPGRGLVRARGGQFDWGRKRASVFANAGADRRGTQPGDLGHPSRFLQGHQQHRQVFLTRRSDSDDFSQKLLDSEAMVFRISGELTDPEAVHELGNRVLADLCPCGQLGSRHGGRKAERDRREPMGGGDVSRLIGYEVLVVLHDKSVVGVEEHDLQTQTSEKPRGMEIKHGDVIDLHVVRLLRTATQSSNLLQRRGHRSA